MQKYLFKTLIFTIILVKIMSQPKLLLFCDIQNCERNCMSFSYYNDTQNFKYNGYVLTSPPYFYFTCFRIFLLNNNSLTPLWYSNPDCTGSFWNFGSVYMCTNTPMINWTGILVSNSSYIKY